MCGEVCFFAADCTFDVWRFGSIRAFISYIIWLSLQGRRILRDEWGGHVSDPLKARAKIFELIKAAGFSHESYGDRSFQEHHSIADSIGAVLHKVFIVSHDRFL